MTRRELMSRLDAAERLDWQVLEDIDPWGQRREDYRIGVLAWVLLGGKKGMLSNYIIDFWRPLPPPPKKQSQVEIETLVKMWIKGSNISFAEQRIGQA